MGQGAMRDRVARNRVGLRCRMHVAMIALNEDRACLLDHAIVIVNPMTPGELFYADFETVIRDTLILELLPATAMQEKGICQIQPLTLVLETFQEVFPDD